jgi:hypothetical protein
MKARVDVNKTKPDMEKIQGEADIGMKDMEHVDVQGSIDVNDLGDCDKNEMAGQQNYTERESKLFEDRTGRDVMTLLTISKVQ